MYTLIRNSTPTKFDECLCSRKQKWAEEFTTLPHRQLSAVMVSCYPKGLSGTWKDEGRLEDCRIPRPWENVGVRSELCLNPACFLATTTGFFPRYNFRFLSSLQLPIRTPCCPALTGVTDNDVCLIQHSSDCSLYYSISQPTSLAINERAAPLLISKVLIIIIICILTRRIHP